MNFVKKLVMSYLITFLYGLFVSVFPLINPYTLITTTFSLMILLFYTLMFVNIGFTFLYIYMLFNKERYELPRKECLKFGNFNWICKLCDCYKECKRENNDKENS